MSEIQEIQGSESKENLINCTKIFVQLFYPLERYLRRITEFRRLLNSLHEKN